MTKKLRLLFSMLMLTLLGSAAWAQEVNYDFTGKDWTASDGTLTNGTVSITGKGSTNFKMNSGYFMLGKSGAYITLPAYDFNVSKIEVVGNNGASSSCKQNIYVDDKAVSTETTGVTGSNSYDIDANYQAAGTQYTIKVTSNHNSQITAIKIYKAGGTVVETVATPTFSPEGGIFTETQSVEINCTTDDAIIYYTTDGSTPTDASEKYNSAIAVEETTTIKAIAVKDGMNNSAVASATYTIKVTDPNWIDFTVQGYTNAQDVTTVTGTNGSVTFKGSGSTAPKWYDSGSAVRIYANNTITITAEEGKKIESVEFSITSGNMSANNFNVEGTYENKVFTPKTPTNSIVYTPSTTIRLDKVKINLSSDTREEAGLSYSAEEYTATIDGQNEFPTLSNPNGLTVSYESTNEGVATIDESGNVTIVAAGTTTIKATSEETETYQAGSASYTLTVTDPNAPGTENNPYTVAKAREAIDANTGITGVYVTGTVYQVDEVSTQYGNATYWISDDGTDATPLEVFRGKYLDGAAFTSEDQIQVGDVVVVYGNLTLYKGTYELNTSNYLVSVEREEVPQVKYYVAGTWTNWQDDMLEMSKSGNTYTLAGQELDAAADFKIVKEDVDGTITWLGGYTDDGSKYWLTKSNHTNVNLSEGQDFHIDLAGTWTFTVTAGDETTAPTLTVDGSWPETEYYLTGAFNEWATADDNYKFTKQQNGTYTLTTTLDGQEFKVWDNDGHWYGSSAGTITKENSVITLADGAENLLIEETVELTFTVDPNAEAGPTLTVTGWPKELPVGNAFVKVTTTDELEDGYYIIVNEDNEVAFNGALETLDANNNIIDVTINNGKIIADDTSKAALFYIESGAEGYTITNLNEVSIGNSSDSNALKTGDYTNSITFEESGDVDIVSANTHLRFNSTSNAKRFRYYKSTSYTGQKAIQLYKLTTLEPVTVKLNKYGYATLYYSDLALTVPENVTATTYLVDANDKVQESVTYAAGDVIPAGEAVVLYSESIQNADVVFELGSTEAAPDDNSLLNGSDELAETVGKTDGDFKFYMLSAKSGVVGFYFGADDGAAFESAAHKAYLAVPVTATTGSKEFYAFGETTGIDKVQGTMPNGQDAIYNLNGQRVSESYKGVIIVNGKKMINK